MLKIAELWTFFSQKGHGKNQKVHGKKLDICLKIASNFSLYRRGYIRFARWLLINPIKRRQKRRHFTPFYPQCTATVSSFGAPVMWLFVSGFGDSLDLFKQWSMKMILGGFNALCPKRATPVKLLFWFVSKVYIWYKRNKPKVHNACHGIKPKIMKITYSSSHIADITDFGEFLNEYCKEKSETCTKF